MAAALACVSCAAMAACGGRSDKVSVTYIYGSKLSPDFDIVEQAVSERIYEETGVEIEFYPITVFQIANYPTLLQGGQMDVICLTFGNPFQLYDLNALMTYSEEEIEQYMPKVTELNKEYPMHMVAPSGDIIGISTREELAPSGSSLILREADLEKAGLADEYKDQDRITVEDLKIIWQGLKDHVCEQGQYPFGATTDISMSLMCFDASGADGQTSGVINLTQDITSTTVVNPFTQDEYIELVELMHEAQEKGWISPSADTNTELVVNLFKNGTARSYFADCSPGLRESTEVGIGETDENGDTIPEPCVQLQILEPYYTFSNTSTGWGIFSGTDNSKEDCMKVLDEMIADRGVTRAEHLDKLVIRIFF